jgi:hypothetical protein
MLATNEIVILFAAAGDAEPCAFDEDFSGTAAGVVIRGLRKAVSSRRPHDEKIARFDRRERPIAREKISRFANGADNVHA